MEVLRRYEGPGAVAVVHDVPVLGVHGDRGYGQRIAIGLGGVCQETVGAEGQGVVLVDLSQVHVNGHG